jgi:hypothetical protein
LHEDVVDVVVVGHGQAMDGQVRRRRERLGNWKAERRVWRSGAMVHLWRGLELNWRELRARSGRSPVTELGTPLGWM